MRAIFSMLLALALTAPAQAADDPTVWLGQVYDLYHRAERQLDLLKDSSEGVAARHASRRFAAQIKRDVDCEVKSHEICALDWDFIVNGQAWELSNVKVGALQASGDRASVLATFNNLKSANRNVFEFVSEDGAWKLDDVVSGQDGRAPIRISRVLRDFKFY